MDENESVDNIDNNDRLPAGAGIGKKAADKGKKLAKKAGKKTADFFKERMKLLWRMLPLKAKIIIIVIFIILVLLASVIIVLADYSVKSSSAAINNYYLELDTETPGSQLYKKTGSLLLATNDEVKEIADKYFEELELRNTTLHQFISKKYRRGDVNNSGTNLMSGALNINDNLTLYEHFLNSERYNFNKIIWKKYLRDEDKGQADLQVDDVTKLQYPQDENNTPLNTFTDMVRPYLQLWIVPYSLFSGLAGEGRGNDSLEDGQFGYQMLLNGYHDITINQYNLEILTETTEQVVYDEITYTIKKTYNVDSSGEETLVSASQVNEIKEGNSCKQLYSSPKLVSSNVSYDIEYKLQNAKLFDKILSNSYNVIKYNKSVDVPEHYVYRTEYKEGEQKSSDEMREFEKGRLVESTENRRIYQNTYSVKKGYKQTDTKTWRDKVESISNEERKYKTDDVKEYIEIDNLSAMEESYYNDLANDNNNTTVRLTRYDIINAKEDVYKKYLKSEKGFSDHIGYARSWMNYAFYTLKNHVQTLAKSETGWKYIYGDSLGIDIELETLSYTNAGGNYRALAGLPEQVRIDSTQSGQNTFTNGSFYNPDGTPKSDRDILALLAFGEAEADVISGMEGVINVILNRVQKNNRTVLETVSSRTQFNCVNTAGTGMDPNRTPVNAEQIEKAYIAVDNVLNESRIDNTGGAEYFYVPDRNMSTSSWIWGRFTTIEAAMVKLNKSYNASYNLTQDEVINAGCISAFHRFAK